MKFDCNRAQTDHRVAFDFEVEFSNGGGLKGWDFRLDIPSNTVTDDDLAASIIKDLRLLMVGSVRISNKRVIQERHKRAARTVDASAPSATACASHIIDLSHVVRDGLQTYPGLPAPSIRDYLGHADSRGRYADGVTFQIGRIDMVANSGTSIDAPYHRYPDRLDVAALPLGQTTELEGVVIRLSGMAGREISAHALIPMAKTLAGKAVLIETGFSSKWGTSAYFVNHPFLTKKAAEQLRDEGVALVGIDSLNIDNTDDPWRPAHSVLLAANVPIVESLTNLHKLPSTGFRFTAAPMRAAGMGAFPVRAWARVEHANRHARLPEALADGLGDISTHKVDSELAK